jgi:hypothetical protein
VRSRTPKGLGQRANKSSRSGTQPFHDRAAKCEPDQPPPTGRAIDGSPARAYHREIARRGGPVSYGRLPNCSTEEKGNG